jgi:hypothetical protein
VIIQNAEICGVLQHTGLRKVTVIPEGRWQAIATCHYATSATNPQESTHKRTADGLQFALICV